MPEKFGSGTHRQRIVRDHGADWANNSPVDEEVTKKDPPNLEETMTSTPGITDINVAEDAAGIVEHTRIRLTPTEEIRLNAPLEEALDKYMDSSPLPFEIKDEIKRHVINNWHGIEIASFLDVLTALLRYKGLGDVERCPADIANEILGVIQPYLILD